MKYKGVNRNNCNLKRGEFYVDFSMSSILPSGLFEPFITN
jgi:hypothetical protein